MSISAFGDNYLPDTLRPYFFLSHPISSHPHYAPLSESNLWSRYYTRGNQDFLFVLGWSLVFTALRWIVMRLFYNMALWWIPAPSRPVTMRSPPNGTPKSAPHANGQPYVSSYSDPHESKPHSRKGRADGVSTQQGDELLQKSERRRHEKDLRKAERVRQRTATRFAEQGFAFLYYSLAWLLGLWVHATIYKTILETDLYWSLYPHTPIAGPVKFYYLIGLTFYSTQVIILNIEERRKDHVQMFTHHIVTVLLMIVSYLTNFTRVGADILFILDWCDIFLPFAKMAKYLSIPLVPDVFFTIFLISWFVTRQIIFLRIVWAVTFDMPVKMDLIWDPTTERYATTIGWIFFASSLWILQVLLTLWFIMACKVAHGVVMGKGAEDSRSDGEVSSDETGSSRSSSRVPRADSS